MNIPNLPFICAGDVGRLRAPVSTGTLPYLLVTFPTSLRILPRSGTKSLLRVLPNERGIDAPPTLREASLKRMNLFYPTTLTLPKWLPTKHLIVPILRPAIPLTLPIPVVLLGATPSHTLSRVLNPEVLKLVSRGRGTRYRVTKHLTLTCIWHPTSVHLSKHLSSGLARCEQCLLTGDMVKSEKPSTLHDPPPTNSK